MYNSDYSIQIANYGHVPYGKTIYGTFIIPNPKDSCNYITNSPENQPAIYIADRTACSFIDKTFYAQMAKGSMLIIVDFWESDENIQHYDRRTDG